MIDPDAHLVATYRRYELLSTLLWTRSRERIAAADSRIGTAPEAFLLAHNWGNTEAKAALRHHDTQMSRLYARSKREYDLARHRDHVATNHFTYLWCEACSAMRAKGAA